jgi:hypothetical protein
MSEPKIRRKFKSVLVTLATATQNATTVRWDDVAGGAVEIGTVSTNATSLQVWASESIDGTFGRLRKVDGSAADITLSPSTVTATVYPIPDEAYGCGAIKLVSAVTHSTAAVAVVMLKS